MHPPIPFAFIPILPCCFTLLSCVWKPSLNIAGSCMWPAVFDGTVGYGRRCSTVIPSIVPVPYLSPTVPCHQRRLATMHIIAIKTALWQFSKKSYCVLVHGPRLKSKKLTKCDSWKLKFHTKPHNNHNTWNAAFNTKLVLHQQLATCMHRKEDH